MTELHTPQLSAHALGQRMRDQARETHLIFNSILVSVAVANAAYVLALLLASGISLALWLPFLMASLGFVFVTLAGTLPGNLLLVSLPDWSSTAFPLFQTMTLFLMFSLLMPVGTTLPLLVDWYLAVGAHSLIGAFWMRDGATKMAGASYEAVLIPLVQSHVSTIRRWSIGAASVGTLWVACWVVIRFWMAAHQPELLRWQGWLGLVALAGSIGIIVRHERYRRAFVQMALQAD